jgi:hypothetical protein
MRYSQYQMEVTDQIDPYPISFITTKGKNSGRHYLGGLALLIPLKSKL